jgi:hypothetical protein
MKSTKIILKNKNKKKDNFGKKTKKKTKNRKKKHMGKAKAQFSTNSIMKK